MLFLVKGDQFISIFIKRVYQQYHITPSFSGKHRQTITSQKIVVGIGEEIYIFAHFSLKNHEFKISNAELV